MWTWLYFHRKRVFYLMLNIRCLLIPSVSKYSYRSKRHIRPKKYPGADWCQTRTGRHVRSCLGQRPRWFIITHNKGEPIMESSPLHVKGKELPVTLQRVVFLLFLSPCLRSPGRHITDKRPFGLDFSSILVPPSGENLLMCKF